MIGISRINLMDIEMFRDFKKSNVNQDYGVP